MAPIKEYVYNGRLNALNWKGCGELWQHKGMDANRTVPEGFYTLGVPGILAATTIPGTIDVDSKRLDDLVRGYVGDRWNPETPEAEFEPVYILEKDAERGLLRVAVEGYVSWLLDDPVYGWVEFHSPEAAAIWVANRR